jgi:hypothetical protein
MLARAAKTQAQKTNKTRQLITGKTTNKKATREVALGWLYDGSRGIFCGLLYRF